MNSPGMQPNFNDESGNHSDDISFDDFEKIESLSRILSDQELELAVKDLLMHSSRIDAFDISVEVDASNVTLSGTVHSQGERDYALSIVKLIQGVGDVHSNLVVKLNPGILPSDIGRH